MRTPARQSDGFVLLAVLLVVMLASMVAVSLMFRMRAEEKAAIAGEQGEQAWAVALSGLARAMAYAASRPPGNSDWADNPEVFREQQVLDDGSERWYFTVYSYGPAETAGARYGLTDEASRVDVRTAGQTNLSRLPKMTRPLAQALTDFVDADGEAQPEGAEQAEYDKLPIVVPNQAPSSLDQILLVHGFTPALFYGEDANLNHDLDPNEDDGDDRFPPDDDNGALDRGLRQYLTVWAYDPNVDNEGLPRVNVNDAGASLQDLKLPEATIACLNAMRQAKLVLAHPSDLLEMTVHIKDASGKDTEYPTGVGRDELAIVMDKLCATDEARFAGLINVNTASAYVLHTVLGIDPPMAEAIVGARDFLAREKRASVAWLFTEGILDAAGFRAVAPYLTARSYQFRCQVAGYSLPSGRYRVLEAVFDLATGKPQVIYLRDITRLGPPFSFRTEANVAHG